MTTRRRRVRKPSTPEAKPATAKPRVKKTDTAKPAAKKKMSLVYCGEQPFPVIGSPEVVRNAVVAAIQEQELTMRVTFVRTLPLFTEESTPRTVEESGFIFVSYVRAVGDYNPDA